MNGLSFVCVAVVAASLVQVGVDAIGSPVRFKNGTKHPHCGMVDNWSAYMAVLDTINSETPSTLLVQMDYDRKLEALLNFTGSKTPVNKVVIDYNKDMLYSVPTAYPDYCYKTPLSLPLIRRIPDDAEYLGSSYLGPLGAGQLDYDGWRFSASKGKVEVTYTLALSRDGCVPLVEGVAYRGNPKQNQLFMFAGFQPKLTDPSAFDLPDSCFK